MLVIHVQGHPRISNVTPMRIVASITFVHQLGLELIKMLKTFNNSCISTGISLRCSMFCTLMSCCKHTELTLDLNPVWSCGWNQVFMWKRRDDSCWFLTDIKGTSSVLYDVNKKHQVSLIRKKDCGCYYIYMYLHVCVSLIWACESVCLFCCSISNRHRVHIECVRQARVDHMDNETRGFTPPGKKVWD